MADFDLDLIIEASEIIGKEYKRYSEKVMDGLRRDAPKTTPSKDQVDIFWGLQLLGQVSETSVSFEEESRGRSYQRSIELPFLCFLYYEYELELDEQILSRYEERALQEGLKYWANKSTILERTKSQFGAIDPGEKNPAIWIGEFPNELTPEVGKELEKFDKNFRRVITDFIESYTDYAISIQKNYSALGFRSTLAHELTHFLVATKTDIGSLRTELSHESFISELVGDTPQEVLVDEIIALEESYAHFCAYQYNNAHSSNGYNAYPKSDYINWMIEILFEKFGGKNVIDDVRLQLIRILRKLASDKKEDSIEGHEPFVLFIRENLPKEDKERFKRFESALAEGILEDFEDIDAFINKIKGRVKSTETKEKLEKIEKEMRMADPRRLETTMYKDIPEKAVENKWDLEETHSEVIQIFEKETGLILDLIKIVKSEPYLLGQEISDDIDDLSKIESELESLI